MLFNGQKVRLVRDVTGEDLGYPEYGLMFYKGQSGEVVEWEMVSGEAEGVAVRLVGAGGIMVEYSMDIALVITEERWLLIELYKDAWQYVHDCALYGDGSMDYGSWDNASDRMGNIQSALPDVDWEAINQQLIKENISTKDGLLLSFNEDEDEAEF